METTRANMTSSLVRSGSPWGGWMGRQSGSSIGLSVDSSIRAWRSEITPKRTRCDYSHTYALPWPASVVPRFFSKYPFSRTNTTRTAPPSFVHTLQPQVVHQFEPPTKKSISESSFSLATFKAASDRYECGPSTPVRPFHTRAALPWTLFRR